MNQILFWLIPFAISTSGLIFNTFYAKKDVFCQTWGQFIFVFMVSILPICSILTSIAIWWPQLEYFLSKPIRNPTND